jgi:hypothetical protein
VDIPASKKLGSTAAQQVAETAKPRWSERIRKRILKIFSYFNGIVSSPNAGERPWRSLQKKPNRNLRD